jgi:hypothetical protein
VERQGYEEGVARERIDPRVVRWSRSRRDQSFFVEADIATN